jgi:hypothetical protein
MGGKQGSEIKEKRREKEEEGKRIRVGVEKRCRKGDGKDIMGKERTRPGERKEQDDNRKEKKKEQKGETMKEQYQEMEQSIRGRVGVKREVVRMH